MAPAPSGVDERTASKRSARQAPTVLLVTGSWHVPQHYVPLINSLKVLGYQVSCPRLPSNAMHIPPADLDDDIVFIRRHAKALIDDGQDLIVVLHSYGGVVGSYSFVDFPAPAAADHAVGGCLRAIVYMAAFMPLAGEGLNDILLPIFGPPKGPPPFVQVDKERGLDVLPVEAAAEYFYQDCTKEEQQRAAALLTPQSSDAPQDAPKRSAVLTELGVTGPRALPELKMSYTRKGVQVVYLYCDLDAGLTLPLQEMMVGRVKKLGVDVYEKHIQAGHSPFSCKPSETAAAVHEMVGLRA